MMLDILRFIFTDGWHFTGTCVLIVIVSIGTENVINAWRGNKD